MKMHTNHIGYLLPFVLLTACESATPEDLREADSVAPKAAAQADTRSNPRIDCTFVSEVSNSDGNEFLDIGSIGGRFFMTRSDHRLQYYDWDGTHLNYVGYVAQSWDRLEWVNSYDWGLVATSESRQKIYYKASNVPRLMGSYPSGVTYITDIAARARYGGLLLDIWVMVPNGGPGEAIRYGQYDKTKAYITWDPTVYPARAYSRGFANGPGPDGVYHLYSMLEYTNSYFTWWSPDSSGNPGSSSYEASFVGAGYTDHAYLHPEGRYDSFGPNGFTYQQSDNMYYGINQYYNSGTGRRAWVLVKMPPSSIMP